MPSGRASSADNTYPIPRPTCVLVHLSKKRRLRVDPSDEQVQTELWAWAMVLLTAPRTMRSSSHPN
eukprot:292261-Rhodomonas_salina.4